jgi:hypothetical protein
MPCNRNSLIQLKRILIDKLIIAQLVKEFSAFHAAQKPLVSSKSHPWDLILSQMNPVYTLKTYLLKKQNSIIHYSSKYGHKDENATQNSRM